MSRFVLARKVAFEEHLGEGEPYEPRPAAVHDDPVFMQDLWVLEANIRGETASVERLFIGDAFDEDE